MPGGPVETMVGVSLIGFGTILAYGAYKNVNPLEMIRQFIETGKFVDPNTLPKLLASTGADAASKAALEGQVVAGIKPKDAGLAKRVQDALEAYFKNPNASTQTALTSLISEMKTKGFSKEAALVENWLNANPPASSSGSTGVVPATGTTSNTIAVDAPSGADFGTTSAVGNLVFDPSTGNWISPT